MHKQIFCTVSLVLLMSCLLFVVPLHAKKQAPPEISHDGLVLRKHSTVDVVYIQPGANLSGYNKIMLQEANIAFKRNWQRDQNHSRSHDRISGKDMARMISRGKDLFDHVFTDALEERGYPVVQEPGHDVLLVRPAIIDLDITSPDLRSAGRSHTYVASSGEATLFVELYDSVTGQILVRAFDRKVDRDSDIRWSMPVSLVTNTQDATRALKYWAKLLTKALDKVKKNQFESSTE